MSPGRSLAKAIDALLEDWRSDPDLMGPEETLVYIEQLVDKRLGRKERINVKEESYD